MSEGPGYWAITVHGEREISLTILSENATEISSQIKVPGKYWRPLFLLELGGGAWWRAIFSAGQMVDVESAPLVFFGAWNKSTPFFKTI